MVMIDCMCHMQASQRKALLARSADNGSLNILGCRFLPRVGIGVGPEDESLSGGFPMVSSAPVVRIYSIRVCHRASENHAGIFSSWHS